MIVTFEIKEKMLKYYNFNCEKVSEIGEFEVMIGSNYKDVLKAKFELK